MWLLISSVKNCIDAGDFTAICSVQEIWFSVITDKHVYILKVLFCAY